jgi:chromatin segregation and condensation protein Rec8/ScpA/Scc1 (kleisin family)
MVVTFIALLDMVKDGEIKIEQADRFLTIRVYLHNAMPVAVEKL